MNEISIDVGIHVTPSVHTPFKSGHLFIHAFAPMIPKCPPEIWNEVIGVSVRISERENKVPCENGMRYGTMK